MRKKKTERQKLVEKLDTLVSIYTRLRDGECVICGATQRLTNGHLFSRYTHSTRWDITDDGNCHCQCMSCNYYHEFCPYPFEHWYQSKFGMDKYDELYQRFHKSVKYKDSQLLELIGDVQQKIKELNS
jgi:hypothetical protein